MKYKIILLSLFLSIIELSAQRTFPETEVIFHTRGASSNQETIFEVIPLLYETVIDNEPISFTTITYRYYSDNSCIVGIQETGTSVKLKGNVSCQNSGLEYIFFNDYWQGGVSCSGNAEYRPFANAIYEIKIKVDNVEKFKFYLDTRHNSLPNNSCDNNCMGNDISIVYSVNNNTIGAINGYWQGGDLNTIDYGCYYTWWEIRDNNCSIALSKFNEKFMPILLEPVNQNYHPYIEWIKADNTQAEANFLLYDLQRSIDYGPFSSCFQTDDFNVTSYLDGGVYWVLNQNAVTVQYRVAAFYDYPLMVDVSNYQKITTVDQQYWKISPGETTKEYSLSQNFPNPFNPFTTINFQLPEDGYVSLIVYDVLGREVSILFDNFKKAGVYTINFDARKLTSGIYLYRLISNHISETKQMLLVK